MADRAIRRHALEAGSGASRVDVLFAGQTEAFRLSMSGATPATSLAELILAVDLVARPAIGAILCFDAANGDLRWCVTPQSDEGLNGLIASWRLRAPAGRTMHLRQEIADLAAAAGLIVAWLSPIETRIDSLSAFVGFARDGDDVSSLDSDEQRAIALAAGVVIEASRHSVQADVERDRYRDFASSAADWYWEQDQDLRFVSVPDSHFSAVVGLRTVRFVGLTRRETNPLGVSEAQWSAHDAALDARQPFRDFRYERVDAEGRRLYLSVSGVPIFTASGEFRGYRGTGRDETDLREAQGRLREQAQEIAEAKLAAEAGSRAKSTFLAHMSHELRTPLNAVIGFSELIRDRPFGDHDFLRYSDYAADIYASGRQLLEMINGILDLSKIEAGAHQIRPESVDVNAFISDCLRLFSIEAQRNSVDLVAHAPVGFVIETDPRALRHIVLNLVSNAVKFSHPGGRVTVSVESDSQGGVEIVVRDMGIGMGEEFLEKALEPFSQADAAISREHRGTGLGLAIARSYAAALGGDLTIASALGVGTTVTVRLPAVS